MHYSIDVEELRALIQGKFDFRKCLNCQGKGLVWVDGDAGLEVVAPDPKNDPDIYYQDQCNDCDGLGGKLKIMID